MAVCRKSRRRCSRPLGGCKTQGRWRSCVSGASPVRGFAINRVATHGKGGLDPPYTCLSGRPEGLRPAFRPNCSTMEEVERRSLAEPFELRGTEGVVEPQRLGRPVGVLDTAFDRLP